MDITITKPRTKRTAKVKGFMLSGAKNRRAQRDNSGHGGTSSRRCDCYDCLMDANRFAADPGRIIGGLTSHYTAEASDEVTPGGSRLIRTSQSDLYDRDLVALQATEFKRAAPRTTTAKTPVVLAPSGYDAWSLTMHARRRSW